jgi:hypothetical protein
MKKRENCEYLNADGRILLKCAFENEEEARTGVVWVETGTRDGLWGHEY